MFGFNNHKTSNKSVAKSVKLVRESGPAVDLNKVTNVNLRKNSEAVGAALAKRGMHGIRAQVVVVLDHSGSMASDYENGKVQGLTERFLGFGLQVDADGEIPVIPFDSQVKSTVNVNLSNYQGVVEREIYKPHAMGSTDLASALKEVEKMAKTTDAPLFVGIVTDGEPNDRDETTEIVCELSRYPVFIKFLAVRPVSYLRELDDLDDSVRLLDNVDAKFLNGRESDDEFAEAMADEFDSWVAKATAAGLLTL